MEVVSAAKNWQEPVFAQSGAGLHKKSCLSHRITYLALKFDFLTPNTGAFPPAERVTIPCCI